MVTFAAVTARYVRFNQTGKSPLEGGAGRWWSIDELVIHCGP
jgi:hypothetical protein